MKCLTLLLPVLALAGFRDLPHAKHPQQHRVLAPKKIKNLGPSAMDKQLKKLLEQDKRIERLLAKQAANVIMRRKEEKVTALSRYRGVLLNSVIAMNVKPAKFIVKVQEGELDGGELRCLGYSFERRVTSRCDLLVKDGKEYQVDVELWDMDGADGVIADYYYSGEEKAFISSSFASFMEGVLEVSKERIKTPFGEIGRNHAKNKILNGLSTIAEDARKKIVESGEKKIAISYVNSGKEVLIFFNQTVNLIGETRWKNF